ncbi:MAG: Sir2 silent information regulator family NAD-dependent deacetylase [Eubacteriales bacterium]|nr:Sir2 silent information regulator family NAD-dependent deacetylase [Eubacteriales bacterium]
MFFKKIDDHAVTTENIERLRKEIEEADAVVIGAGAGLSTAAGFTYSGERFVKYFSDFREKYGIGDMYSGGFYPYQTLEEFWGFWARNIYVNRYMEKENEVYKDLLHLVKDKDYFVLTTNVDHQFQLAGFDKQRLFYTQGDYGLWQCMDPCHQETYDNEEQVIQMLLAQRFLVEKEGEYVVDFENKANWKMDVPTEMIPKCPHCGKPLTTNLRCDNTFVQDDGWYAAQNRFASFLSHHGVSGSFGFVNVPAPTRGDEDQKVVYLELGIGANTPSIVKYPFWRATHANPNATYVCMNYGEAYAPNEIRKQSICLDGDIKDLLKSM